MDPFKALESPILMGPLGVVFLGISYCIFGVMEPPRGLLIDTWGLFFLAMGLMALAIAYFSAKGGNDV